MLQERANNYSIRAVSPGHQEAELTIIMKGRYLNEGDITNRKKQVVIGRLVAEDLFQDEDPIGKYIFGSGHSWKVVGAVSYTHLTLPTKA